MRLLHTSDWHLGRAFHGEGLGPAHEMYLDHLVDLARDEQVDAVLVSGDVYDRALPNPRSVELLDDTLFRLLDTGARVIVTSGNHDSAIRLGFGSRVMERSGLHIRSSVSGIAHPIAVPGRGGTDAAGRSVGHVVALPYLEPAVHAGPLGADEATHASVLGRAVEIGMAAVPDDDLPTVGMAHAFFAGATSSESERDICVGGLGVAPTSILAPFDYSALGHLHGKQHLGERIRYSGSPVPMSFSEAGHTKGTWLVDLSGRGEEGTIDARFIEAPVYRPLAILRGTLEELLADDALADAEAAWCQVTLTNEIRPASAMDRLRARFPHTLRLLFDTPRTDDAPVTYAERLAGRDDVELCCDFLAHVRGGRGPSATERTAIGQAVAAAGRRDDEPQPATESLLPIEGLT